MQSLGLELCVENDAYSMWSLMSKKMQNPGNLVMCNIVLAPSPFSPVPFQSKRGPNLQNQALNHSQVSFPKKETLLVFRGFLAQHVVTQMFPYNSPSEKW